MKRTGFLLSGTIVADNIIIIDSWPEQDALCRIESSKLSNGGFAFNIAKDLANMKAEFPIELSGIIGCDINGDFVIESCKASGINSGNLARTYKTGTTFCNVMTAKDSGRRTFFYFAGSGDELSEKNIPLEKSNAKIFAHGYIGLHKKLDALNSKGENTHANIFKKAKSLGFQTASDLVSIKEPIKPILSPSLPYLDYMSMNEIEFSNFFELDRVAKNPDEIVEIGKKIFEFGLGKILFVHMSQGVIAISKDMTVERCGSLDIPQSEIKGTNGAGDALYAGILYGIHEEYKIKKCLELGVANACASLRDASPSEGIKSLNDTLSLLKKYTHKDF